MGCYPSIVENQALLSLSDCWGQFVALKKCAMRFLMDTCDRIHRSDLNLEDTVITKGDN